MIAAVAAANPHTVVVLETGGPVTMPWVANVGAVMAAWYPGIAGGEAIADLLFGRANPSARLPITFARSESDLPEPVILGGTSNIVYKEGLAVGYRWYEVSHTQPLFAFGHGLSYTTFKYSDLTVDPATRTVRFAVSNTGATAGAEVAQVYVRLPAASAEPFQRLAGWERFQLAPGERRTITLKLDPAYISIFDEKSDRWQLLPGDYEVHVGGSSDSIALRGTLHVGG